jgi:hypothetical protein
MPDLTNWVCIITGWGEVSHYIARYPNARIVVVAAGNGAVRVHLPTREAREAFIE